MYRLHNGQTDSLFVGLFGGWMVYDWLSCSRFLSITVCEIMCDAWLFCTETL